MKFLIDANLPPGLVDWIADRGHDAQHVRVAPGADSDDASIVDFAREHGLIIVTKDEDFATRVTLDRLSPPVVWLRLGNATNAVLRDWLQTRFDAVIREQEQGSRLVEVV